MLRLIAALFVLAPVSGCLTTQEATVEEPIPIPTLNGEPAEVSPDLEEARERWRAADLSGYQMTLQRICYCPSPDYTGPFRVTVRNAEVTRVQLDGSTVDTERGVSVDALFALIDDAYKRGAVEVALAFHPELGYPTSIGIDYDRQLADEEIAYRVSDLASL